MIQRILIGAPDTSKPSAEASIEAAYSGGTFPLSVLFTNHIGHELIFPEVGLTLDPSR